MIVNTATPVQYTGIDLFIQNHCYLDRWQNVLVYEYYYIPEDQPMPVCNDHVVNLLLLVVSGGFKGLQLTELEL